MRRTPDTLLRQWAMLRLIPRSPRSIGTRELKARLEEQGFAVELRTIQRDLGKLSRMFPLTEEANGKALRWSWMAEAAPLDIPGMDPPTALAFQLAAAYLRPLLPPTTLAHLEPHIRRAQEVLAGTRGTQFSLWPDKVCPIVRGPFLQQPAILTSVQEAVYQALLADRQLTVVYRSKAAATAKTYEVHPLGLVFRDGVVYLVCTVKDYEDIRHLALHRIASAKVLDQPAHRPAQFTLSRYVKEEQFFSYPVQGQPIRLEVLFERAAAVHLFERPLARDQQLIPKKDGRILLRATVRDTLELRWWLRGFGDQVEVLAPESWRNEFATMAQRLAKQYSATSRNHITAKRKTA